MASAALAAGAPGGLGTTCTTANEILLEKSKPWGMEVAFGGLWEDRAAPTQGRLCCGSGLVTVLHGLDWVTDPHNTGAFAAVWRC